jgi:DNA-binding MarR family transcriptional regulator
MAAGRTWNQKVDVMARECIARRVRMLNRVVSGLYDEALRPFGLKVSQMNILVATAKFGVAQPGPMSKVLELDPSTLSRNVERMRARNWLEPVEAPDGREQPFRLTTAGVHLLQNVAPVWERTQREAEKLLGKEGVDWLGRQSKIFEA